MHLDNCRSCNQLKILRCVLGHDARVVRRKSIVDLNDVQAKSRGLISEIFTHPGCFNGYALFVLSIEGIAEETDREVQRGRHHAVPMKFSGNERSAPNGA